MRPYSTSLTRGGLSRRGRTCGINYRKHMLAITGDPAVKIGHSPRSTADACSPTDLAFILPLFIYLSAMIPVGETRMELQREAVRQSWQDRKSVRYKR